MGLSPRLPISQTNKEDRIGDVCDFLLSYMVFRTCCSVEPPLPASLRLHMWLNLVIDFAIGLVPVLGDLADAFYKCNTKNVVLLERELRKRGAKRMQTANQVSAPDPSLPEVYDREEEERMMVEQHGPPPRYNSAREPRRPEPTHNFGRQDRDLEAAEGAPPPQPTRPGRRF